MAGGLGVDVTVARALEEAEKKITQDFVGRPRAEATARHALGVTWQNLTGDRFPRAEDPPSAERPDLRGTRTQGQAMRTRLRVATLLGVLRREWVVIQIARTLNRVRELRADARPPSLLTLGTLTDLGLVYQVSGRRADATRLFEQVLEKTIAQFGSDHQQTQTILHNLAGEYQFDGRVKDAIRLSQRTGPRSPDGETRPRAPTYAHRRSR